MLSGSGHMASWAARPEGPTVRATENHRPNRTAILTARRPPLGGPSPTGPPCEMTRSRFTLAGWPGPGEKAVDPNSQIGLRASLPR